ncbi:unnamed protein product [Pieris brassicae]|uniref:Uncharacterized protein n=1 Tax=Pieris brassicae TaxID=7116 RepID=A0A9P0TH81_PIEBR|nr:unnamed protein product [Pieris brassicae]
MLHRKFVPAVCPLHPTSTPLAKIFESYNAIYGRSEAPSYGRGLELVNTSRATQFCRNQPLARRALSRPPQLNGTECEVQHKEYFRVAVQLSFSLYNITSLKAR